ncbi:MAG: MFS transporter, partial [Leptospiraceae bacterium]|nr:MFS transporter [Leptospiraceae bacterium]
AGVPLGLLIANKIDWQASFLSLALVSFFLWIFSFFILPNVKEHLASQNLKTYKTLTLIVKDKNVIYAFLFMTSLMLAGFSVIPFISPYLVANVKILESQLSYIYFVGGATTLFTANIIGKLADKFGKKEIFQVIAFLSIVPILLITNLGQVGLILALGVSTLFFVFVSGRMVPAMAILSSVVSKEKRGIFLSLNTSVQQFASGIASFISSSIIGKTATNELTNYWIVGFIGLSFSLVSIFISRKLQVLE